MAIGIYPALAWLIPPTCILCGGKTHRPLDLCTACELDLPWNHQACHRCGLPLLNASSSCGACMKIPPAFDQTIAAFIYQEPIIRLITDLKFRQQLLYSRILGELLAKKVASAYLHKRDLPDMIIPIPLHNHRLRERGFNQAVELAKPIAKKFNIKIDYQDCTRILATQPQSTISAQHREHNVKNAFQVSKILKDKHVAVIDDVMTTGATMREFTLTLKKANVRKIDVWCCARTINQSF